MSVRGFVLNKRNYRQGLLFAAGLIACDLYAGYQLTPVRAKVQYGHMDAAAMQHVIATELLLAPGKEVFAPKAIEQLCKVAAEGFRLKREPIDQVALVLAGPTGDSEGVRSTQVELLVFPNLITHPGGVISSEGGWHQYCSDIALSGVIARGSLYEFIRSSRAADKHVCTAWCLVTGDFSDESSRFRQGMKLGEVYGDQRNQAYFAACDVLQNSSLIYDTSIQKTIIEAAVAAFAVSYRSNSEGVLLFLPRQDGESADGKRSRSAGYKEQGPETLS